MKKSLGLLTSFLMAVLPALAGAAVLTCPDPTMNGRGPVPLSFPCPTKLAVALPANGALVAQAIDAKGTKSYWTAWGGVPATSFVLTDGGTWVQKSSVTTPAPAAATGQADITWTAVATNTDGTGVATPVSYKVYGGTTQPLALKTTTATLEYLWVGLTPGSWMFSVSAVDANGTESALSNPVTKVIASAPPGTPAVTVK